MCFRVGSPLDSASGHPARRSALQTSRSAFAGRSPWQSLTATSVPSPAIHTRNTLLHSAFRSAAPAAARGCWPPARRAGSRAASNTSHSTSPVWFAHQAIASLDATLTTVFEAHGLHVSGPSSVRQRNVPRSVGDVQRAQEADVWLHSQRAVPAATTAYALAIQSYVDHAHEQLQPNLLTSSAGADPEESSCVFVSPSGRGSALRSSHNTLNGTAVQRAAASGSNLGSGTVTGGAVDGTTSATGNGPFAFTTATLGSSSSTRSSSTISSSSSSQTDNWLEAVLSATTNRLSSSTNEAVMHSLNRLASLRYAPDHQELDDLLEVVRWQFGSLQLQDFEQIAANLACLGHSPSADWLHAFERECSRLIRGGSPRLLARTLHALTQLGYSPSPHWLEPALEEMRLNPKRMTLHSWTLALWSCAKLRHRPSPAWFNCFLFTSADKLQDGSAKLLTSLLWSLARLQVVPTAQWLQRCAQAAARLVTSDAYSPSQLVQSMSSVAALAPLAGGSAPLQQLAECLLQGAAQLRHLMHPAGLTQVLGVLGRFQVPLDATHLQQLLSTVQEQLPRLTPEQFTTLCTAVAKLPDHSPDPAFSEALQLELSAQLPQLPNGALGTLLWAMGRMRCQVDPEVQQHLWLELERRCGSISSAELSAVLWGCSKLGLQPPVQWLMEVLGQTQQQLAALTSQEAANLTWGLWQLGHQPPVSWLVAYEASTLQVLPTAQPQEVIALHYGLVKLGYQPSAAWQEACLQCLRRGCAAHGQDLTRQQAEQLLQQTLELHPGYCMAVSVG